jgi:hypothetical protein
MRTSRIVSDEPLTWKVLVNDHFPCMLCREKNATRMVRIQAGEATINACLCEGCAGREPHDIMNGLMNRSVARKAA